MTYICATNVSTIAHNKYTFYTVILHTAYIPVCIPQCNICNIIAYVKFAKVLLLSATLYHDDYHKQHIHVPVQSMNHISLENRPRCYVELPTVQDTYMHTEVIKLIVHSKVYPLHVVYNHQQGPGTLV